MMEPTLENNQIYVRVADLDYKKESLADLSRFIKNKLFLSSSSEVTFSIQNQIYLSSGSNSSYYVPLESLIQKNHPNINLKQSKYVFLSASITPHSEQGATPQIQSYMVKLYLTEPVKEAKKPSASQQHNVNKTREMSIRSSFSKGNKNSLLHGLAINQSLADQMSNVDEIDSENESDTDPDTVIQRKEIYDDVMQWKNGKIDNYCFDVFENDNQNQVQHKLTLTQSGQLKINHGNKLQDLVLMMQHIYEVIFVFDEFCRNTYTLNIILNKNQAQNQEDDDDNQSNENVSDTDEHQQFMSQTKSKQSMKMSMKASKQDFVDVQDEMAQTIAFKASLIQLNFFTKQKAMQFKDMIQYVYENNLGSVMKIDVLNKSYNNQDAENKKFNQFKTQSMKASIEKKILTLAQIQSLQDEPEQISSFLKRKVNTSHADELNDSDVSINQHDFTFTFKATIIMDQHRLKRSVEVDMVNMRLMIFDRKDRAIKSLDQKLSKIVQYVISINDNKSLYLQFKKEKYDMLVQFSSIFKRQQFCTLYNLFHRIKYQKDVKLESSLKEYMLLLKDNKLTYQNLLTQESGNSFQQKYELAQNKLATQLKTKPHSLDYTVWVQTWNMAGEDQKDTDIEQFLKGAFDNDIAIVGAQEFDFKSNQIQGSFVQRVIDEFKKKGYVLINQMSMWQMFVLAFCKMEMAPYVDYGTAQFHAAGFGKVIGNKGGLQLHFRIFNKWFNVMLVHLKHGKENQHKRDLMMREIVDNLRNMNNQVDPDFLSDINIIFGDMNYRTEIAMKDFIDEVKTAHTRIQELDQLHDSMYRKDQFTGYEEMEIKFMPTYKTKLEKAGEYWGKENHAPSFTDRILVKNNSAQDITFLKYISRDEILGSDHRPVNLVFKVKQEYTEHVDTLRFLSPLLFDYQQVGIISVRKLWIKQFDISQLYKEAKQKIKFPAKLNLKVISTDVEHFASSTQKSVQRESDLIFKDKAHMAWSDQEFSYMITPINSLEILKNNRLVILLRYYNLTDETEHTVGQINVKLNKIVTRGDKGRHFIEIEDEPITHTNVKMGVVSGQLEYNLCSI